MNVSVRVAKSWYPVRLKWDPTCKVYVAKCENPKVCSQAETFEVTVLAIHESISMYQDRMAQRALTSASLQDILISWLARKLN